MKQNENIGYIRLVECKKCGREFVPAPLHRFKVGGKYYCKWTCYNHRADASGEVTEHGKVIGDFQ